MWATLWRWCRDSGWWRGQRRGGEGVQVADSPHLPFAHPKRVKERRPVCAEMVKLQTPLENQESMFQKKKQKPKRKQKWRKVQTTSCTLVVLKIKTVQRPGCWLVNPVPSSHHFPTVSLLSLGSQNVLSETGGLLPLGPLLSEVLLGAGALAGPEWTERATHCQGPLSRTG